MTSVGIVTGAGSGMGAACAARLVGDVDGLILADRNADAVASATTNVSTGQADTIAIPVVMDVTDVDNLARLADQVLDTGTLRGRARGRRVTLDGAVARHHRRRLGR